MYATLIEIVCARRQLIDKLFSLVGINILIAGLSFVTTLVVANVLGIERYGVLSYAIAVGGYFFTIARCGLDRTLIRDLVHFPDKFDEHTSANILLCGAMLMLGFIIMLGMDTLVSEENHLGIAGVLIVLSLGIKVLDLAPIYDAWDKMKRHAVYLLVERCVYFACVWSVVFLSRDSLSIFAISIIMIISATLGITIQYCWALPRLVVRMDRKTLSMAVGMLKQNLWIWSAVLATLSFGVLSKIILKLVSGNSELGGYSVAWQVVMLGSILISQISRIANPRMAKMAYPGNSKADQIRFIVKYISLMLLATSFVSIPSMFFPQTVLRIFRPEYATAARPMAVLGVYVMVVGIGQVATQYLIVVRKERFYSISVILCGAFGLLLYAVFIPRWHAFGAALAVLLSHGSLVLVHCVAVLLHLRNNTMAVSVDEKIGYEADIPI